MSMYSIHHLLFHRRCPPSLDLILSLPLRLSRALPHLILASLPPLLREICVHHALCFMRGSTAEDRREGDMGGGGEEREKASL